MQQKQRRHLQGTPRSLPPPMPRLLPHPWSRHQERPAVRRQCRHVKKQQRARNQRPSQQKPQEEEREALLRLLLHLLGRRAGPTEPEQHQWRPPCPIQSLWPGHRSDCLESRLQNLRLQQRQQREHLATATTPTSSITPPGGVGMGGMAAGMATAGAVGEATTQRRSSAGSTSTDSQQAAGQAATEARHATDLQPGVAPRLAASTQRAWSLLPMPTRAIPRQPHRNPPAGMSQTPAAAAARATRHPPPQSWLQLMAARRTPWRP